MQRRAWLRLLLAVPLLALSLQRPAAAAACSTPDWWAAVEAADIAGVADVRTVRDVGANDLVTVRLDYAIKSQADFNGTFFRPKDAPPLYPGGTYALALVRVAGDKFVLPACSAAWAVPKPMISIPENPSAVGHLMDAGVIVGDGGPLRLDLPITRAELVTLLVRAARRADEAAQRRDEAPWPDLRGHWAAGWVAVAKDMGLVRGDSAGSFAPDRLVTAADAVTMVDRFLGLREPPDEPWPQGELSVAVQFGLIPSGATFDRTALTRDWVFRLLDTAFLMVPQPGGTVYQRLLHTGPLQLRVTDLKPGPDGLQVGGDAPGASWVYVNGEAAAVDPFGRFQYRGAHAPVLVLAVDWTGWQGVWTQPASVN